MARSQTERQRDSDARRGVVAKSYKLPQALVDTIAQIAAERGIPQNQVIQEAVELYVGRLK